MLSYLPFLGCNTFDRSDIFPSWGVKSVLAMNYYYIWIIYNEVKGKVSISGGMWIKGATCWPSGLKRVPHISEIPNLNPVRMICCMQLPHCMLHVDWRDLWWAQQLISPLGSHTLNSPSQGEMAPSELGWCWTEADPMFSFVSAPVACPNLITDGSVCLAKVMYTLHSFCENLIAVQPNGSLPSFKQALFSPLLTNVHGQRGSKYAVSRDTGMQEWVRKRRELFDVLELFFH